MSLKHAQIRAFNAVAHTGGFTAAADQLNISQPAVTAQIRQLEEEYGKRLFERLGRNVRLTALGEQLYRLTSQIGDLEEAAASLLTGRQDLAGQVIRVATASPQVCMPLIHAFTTKHPRTSIEISVGSSADSIARVMDRLSDVAITPVLQEDERLATTPIAQHRLGVLMPKGHELEAKETLAIEDIMPYPLIQRTQGSMTQMTVDSIIKRRRLRMRAMLTLDTREAVHEAVAAKLGLALVLHRDVSPDPRLRLKLFDDVEERVTERAIWLHRRANLPIIREFSWVAMEMAASNFFDDTPGD